MTAGGPVVRGLAHNLAVLHVGVRRWTHSVDASAVKYFLDIATSGNLAKREQHTSRNSLKSERSESRSPTYFLVEILRRT
jgi:hypothetical protein